MMSWFANIKFFSPWASLLECFVVMSALSLTSAKLNYTLVEESPLGKFVADLAQDGNFESGHSYSFIDGPHNDLFMLEENGLLKVKRRIDRDVICPNANNCTIQLVMGVQLADFTRLQVDIELLDINDNSPVFSAQHKVLTVSEGASGDVRFPLQPATDPDSPPNSTIRYQLIPPGGMFTLSVRNALGIVQVELVLAGQLDREKQDFYQFTLLAHDSAGLEPPGRLLIDINVDDVNDNIPSFGETSYEVDVSEDEDVGFTVITLHADDPDSGVNGEVTYEFAPATAIQNGDTFKVDSTTGDVTLKKPLDYEARQSFSLEVLAVDGGIGSVRGSTTVSVTVIDVNDNAPVITVSGVSGDERVTVTEHSGTEQFVAYISVFDEDDGDNGGIDCRLNSEDDFNLVRLLETDYKIVTARDFDREIQSEYQLVFRCQDRGSAPQFSSADITVYVVDINDHGPVFRKPVYTKRLRENNELGVLIVDVEAFDLDSGDNGRVSYMVDDDGEGMFRVDPDTGLVTALMSFDREVDDYIEFHIIAADRSDDVAKTASCLVQLTIEDEDDEPPVFRQATYEFGVAENQPARVPVGSVYAEDQDLPPFNQFSYNLDLNSVSSGYFSVDSSSGLITTKRVLDREKIQSYQLRVVARSDTQSRFTATCTVLISVSDENDNAPLILYPTSGNNTINMPVNMREGDHLTTVEAYDVDSGVNSVMRFAISNGNSDGGFRVEEHTGRIIINADPETFTKTLYTLTITVRDSGTPQQVSVSNLTIVLVAAPVVTTPILTIDLTDDTPVVGHSGNPNNDDTSGFTRLHLAIVLGVILGCILLALVLILVIILVRRRRKNEEKPVSSSDELYWPKQAGQSSMAPHGVMNNASQMTPDSNRMAEIPNVSGMLLTLDTQSNQYSKHILPSEDHSPKSDHDCDSGCADMSNAGSQTSNDDSEGSSKRSSKASDAGAGNELPLTAILSRPHLMLPSPASSSSSVPPLLPGVPPMPLLSHRLSIDRPGSATPDIGSHRRAQRYPDDDTNFRRTYSTPPKGQIRGALHSLVRGQNYAMFPPTNSDYSLRPGVASTLPRTHSNSSRKSVRFSDDNRGGNPERPETPKSEKHVHFADEDDIFNTSYTSNSTSSENDSLALRGSTDNEGKLSCAIYEQVPKLLQKSSESTKTDEISLEDMYPADGTYTTFVPLTNTNLSSLV